MNAHQKLVYNRIMKLTPKTVAENLASPPGNQAKGAKGHTVRALHDDVLKYAKTVDEIIDAWENLLADAAGVETEDGWPALWAGEIAELMADLPERHEAEVTSIDRAAA